MQPPSESEATPEPPDTVLPDTVLPDTVLADTVLADTVLANTVLANTGITPLPADADADVGARPAQAESEPARPVAGGQPDGAGLASFTLALPVRERRVLVVGGGESATAMVTALRASGALVRVVAATLSPELTELAARGLIEVASRQYQVRDLADAWLAFACSEHRSVNAALAFDAEQARVWCVVPEDAARPPPAAAPAGQRVLVLGGARSGKSATAEAMLANCAAVEYVATGHRPGPDHWRRVETLDLASVLAADVSAAVLIDCLASWLSQLMDDDMAARRDEVVQAWAATTRRVVAVSNEIGSGAEPGTESGRRFRDELGWLNCQMAAAADEVWLCTAGIPTRLR